MSSYYKTLSEIAQSANLQMSMERWYDEERRVHVINRSYYLLAGSGERLVIATAKEYVGYDYEFSMECLKAIYSIREFLKWV